MSDLWCLPPPLAYLDPGSGSLLLQAAVGALLGALLTIKTWGRRLFRRARHHGRQDEPTPK